MSQIKAFKYNGSSIPLMVAKHFAAVLLLIISLICVSDQERMQFLLLFCKNIICLPALDTPSYK